MRHRDLGLDRRVARAEDVAAAEHAGPVAGGVEVGALHRQEHRRARVGGVGDRGVLGRPRRGGRRRRRRPRATRARRGAASPLGAATTVSAVSTRISRYVAARSSGVIACWADGPGGDDDRVAARRSRPRTASRSLPRSTSDLVEAARAGRRPCPVSSWCTVTSWPSAAQALGGRGADQAGADDQDLHRRRRPAGRDLVEAGAGRDQLVDALGAEELLRQLVHRVHACSRTCGPGGRARAARRAPRPGPACASRTQPSQVSTRSRTASRKHLDGLVVGAVGHVGVRDRRVERAHVGAVADRPDEPVVAAQGEPLLVLGLEVPVEVVDVDHRVAARDHVAEVEDVRDGAEDEHQVRHVDVRAEPDLEVHVQDRGLAVADPGVDQPLDAVVRVADVGVERALVAAVLGGPVLQAGARRVRLRRRARR